MNILFYVGGYNFYGSERKMLSIMKGLMDKGHNVHCIGSGWSDGVFKSKLTEEKIPNSSSKLGFIYLTKIFWTLDTLLHFPAAVIHHFKIASKLKAQIVYHNYYRSIVMVGLMIPSHKNILHIGDVININFKNKMLFKLVDLKCKSIIASSNYIRDNLVELGVNKDKIKVVLNGVETIKSINRVPSSKIRFGIVGQIIPRKGHLELIEAFNILRKTPDFEIEKVQCVVYGGGEQSYIDQLKDTIKSYNLDSIFVFKGFVSDKSQIYEHLDVVVVPSHYEAFGFSALEPAFYKIPVIASNTGGLKEIVIDGNTGLLFKTKDPMDLAAKMRNLCMDLDLTKKMGQKANVHVNRYFTVERMVDEIEGVLISK